MKKALTLALTVILIAAMAVSVSAKVFTDFENYSSFKAGANRVYADGDVADYWIGNWADANEQDAVSAEIVDGKGVNGSKALKIVSEAMDNVGLYLFTTASNKISTDYTGMKYLRVWMDMSGDVGFRKANYGTTDSSYSLFTTDEENSNNTEWPFYYMADGSSSWETMYHGGDGCFGDAQESDVYGFKGYFAFPVEDFVIRDNANWDGLDKDTPAPMGDVTGVYLFWDYSDLLAGGDPFYIDNIEFVADYTVFDAPAAAHEPAAEVPAATAEPVTAPAAEPAVTTPAAPVVTTAAQTSDLVIVPLALMASAAAAFAASKKRR